MNGRQTASRKVSLALSDTRRGHQGEPGATSSTLYRHPDSNTLVQPGAQGPLGNLQTE